MKNPVNKIIMEKRERKILIRIPKTVDLQLKVKPNNKMLKMKMTVEPMKDKLEFGPITEDQKMYHWSAKQETDL